MAADTSAVMDTTAFDDFDNRYLKHDPGFAIDRTALDRLPVIDIAPFVRGGSRAECAAVAKQIRKACIDIGFFYVTGHGFSVEEINAVLNRTHGLFELPVDRKQEMHISKNPAYVGYDGKGIYPDSKAKEAADLREAFFVTRERYQSEPANGIAGKSFWPNESDLPGYKAMLQSYVSKQCAFAQTMLRAFAMSLDVPETFFDDAYRFPSVKLALNYYPSVDMETVKKSQWGISPHTDYGGFTILAQDSRGGLQVRNSDGTWLSVPPVEGSFVINIGDLFAMWTNDLYTSNLHRAFNARPGARVSLAFFVGPHEDTDVTCIPTCASAENPPKYETIAAGPFRQHLVVEGHKNGRNGYSARTMERFKRK